MFRLMVPSTYQSGHRLEGAIGGTPDTDLIGSRHQCRRSTLPPFLDSLVFNFVGTPQFGVLVQNFYHLGDFFVVSDTLKRFLEVHAGCAFEAKPIQTKHPDGEETGQFWAMKVVTRIDCILPDQSFAYRRLWPRETAESFRDLAVEIKLTAEMSPYFANRGSDTYYAYPGGFEVTTVSTDFSSVPRELKLFEPLYWPHFLVVDIAFANELKKQCRRKVLGNYFWTLGFDRVADEYNETMRDER